MTTKKLIGFVCIGVAAVVLIFAIAFMAGRNSAKATNDDGDLTADAAGSAVEVEEPAAVEVPPPDDLPEMSAHAEDDYEISAGAGADYEMPADAGPNDSPMIAAADSADVPEDAVLDEYGMYRVSMEWASERGGVFVERGKGLYTVTPLVPRYLADEYGIGQLFGGAADDLAQLYFGDKEEGAPDEVQTSTKQAIISAGDFPILRVSRNEKLEYFAEKIPSKVSVIKTDFVGYTVPTIGVNCLIDRVFTGNFTEHLSVSELNGNPVADIRKLEYGQQYLVEWYYGTEYHSAEMTADCRCYVRPSKQDAIELPTKLTKFGYVEVDISGLEPGVYAYRDVYFGDSVFEVID